MRHLQPFLDPLADRYSDARFLASDPLEYVHHYTDPWDQEAVALVAALLAYGNVKQIRRSVEDLLRRMREAEGGPAAFVRSLGTPEGVKRAERKAFSGFVHRFNVGRDLVMLLRLLESSWRRHGSLGGHFMGFHEPGARDFAVALDALILEWREQASRWAGPKGLGSFEYLLTAPAQGSCCKRWCMFLRWMGRRDALDPGLWTADSPLRSTFPRGRSLRPDQLVIPLDTHTGRISQYLGLTRRKSLNWKAALEVTEGLRACRPDDPVRYDFALARLGILDLCQKTYRAEVCSGCELLRVCRYGGAC